MSPPQPPRVDPKIWQLCAGPSAKIPKIHSKVYYFPQGHLEHACSFPNASVLVGYPPSIPCIVSAVDLLADPHTDEIFAKLLLTPVTVDCSVQEPSLEVLDQEDDGDEVVSFVKILTLSDSNSSAFPVPRQCAELIFPKIDLQAPLPSQKLLVTDVQDKVWEYTHSYRGNPKRHMLTTGWSSFVSKKKLVVGDSLLFIKNSAGKVVVGIRRNMKFTAAKKKKDEEGKEGQLELVEGEGFLRSGKKEMFTEKAVMDAVELAEKNTAFEVVYHPRPNCCDFVVNANVVDDSLKFGWASGMRVKLPMKKDESSNSKTTLYHPQATISNVSSVPNWRMLEVNWDEPEIAQSPNRVNPWQVELISLTPTMYQPFPSMKKPRVAQDSTLTSDKKGNSLIPFLTIESLKETLWNQGARHDCLSDSGSSNSLNDESNPMAGLSTASTSLDIGRPTSNDPSPHDHSNLNTFGTTLVETNNNAKSVNPPGSIKLFGKIIHPVKSNVHDSGIEDK